MADEGKPRFEIPWATLLPLIAALGGVVAQFRPLISARPNIPNGKPVEYTAIQDVDARLWQDPLVVAEKAKERVDADMLSSGVPTSRMQRHTLDALIERVCDAAGDGPTMLLAVMLDAGPYIEQEESRLRARQGVLEGLNASGFVPNDSEHIGFITLPGEPSPRWKKPDEQMEDGALLIPWEECDANDIHEPVYPRGTKKVFVLWLPSSSFGPRPLEALAQKLVRPFREEIPHGLQIVLLGPANSTGLQAMVREGPDDKSETNPYQVLDGVRIVSPRATASDQALIGENDGVSRRIKSYVRNRGAGGLQFERTVLTDDLVLEHLLAELERRRVHLSDRRANGKWKDADRVVVLSEWDSPYGRNLAKTFAEKADARGAKTRLSFYRYMHGIDGRLPGDSAKTPEPVKPAVSQAAAATEATEGVDRSDFLRRLAGELKEQDKRDWRTGKLGIRAIGLLGSDIFDKLMILRALRPEFPDAIFFTNNFDAHFERKEDWSDVRNLVIASPFGATLEPLQRPEPGSELRQRVAPFRDTNQTSMYFGTLVATGCVSEAMLAVELAQQPRLFEVGRHGAQPLYDPGKLASRAGGRVEREKFQWFLTWLKSPQMLWPLAIATLALLLLIAWNSLSVVDRRAVGGGSLIERAKHVGTSTIFLLVCGVPFIVVAVGLLAQTGDAVLEPLAFFSGLSIWPSEMLRLIALMLAIHFMLKASRDLRLNEREITRRFFPGARISHKWRFDLGLHRWQKEHPRWVRGRAPFPARKAWAAYLRRNHFWPRCIRITALTIMYAAFSIGFYLLFPSVAVPARGEVAFQADSWILGFTVLATMALTFYVVDAFRLTSNFIRILTRSVTEWSPPLSLVEGRVPPLEKLEVTRFFEISFVARRTEAIAPLIWYPLIVLAISLLARNPIFDHWTWPIFLVIIFSLNAAWAFGSAIFLRRSAEDLRAAAIHSLQDARVKSYAQPEKRPVFEELIAEVRAIRTGAFAPLSEQPFIRAILYPSGGIGLIAVAQRLLDIF